jgi:enoyl-CoA hydratase
MIFTGKMIPAAEAQSMGLVNKVCAQGQLMDEVLNVAKIIVSKGKVSLRAAKQAINTGMDVDLKTGCRIEIDAFAICLASPDAKEGTRAFLEKRAADFKGGLQE